MLLKTTVRYPPCYFMLNNNATVSGSKMYPYGLYRTKQNKNGQKSGTKKYVAKTTRLK